MPRPDRSQYLDYEGKWLIRFYEEADDFVILVQHYPTKKIVLRFDQSSHEEFHADFYDIPKYESFGVINSFEEKVKIAFKALKKYCKKGIVQYTGEKLKYTNVIESVKDQLLNREISKGTDRNFRNMLARGNIKVPSLKNS